MTPGEWIGKRKSDRADKFRRVYEYSLRLRENHHLGFVAFLCLQCLSLASFGLILAARPRPFEIVGFVLISTLFARNIRAMLKANHDYRSAARLQSGLSDSET